VESTFRPLFKETEGEKTLIGSNFDGGFFQAPLDKEGAEVVTFDKGSLV
jgi:hypothetical protein